MKTFSYRFMVLYCWLLVLWPGQGRGQTACLDADFNPPGGADSSINSIALQSDGKVVIVGNFTNVNGFEHKYIARLLTDGSLDRTFACSPGPSSWLLCAAVQADGKILIGGDFTSVNGTNRARIARLNRDGSLDLSFNPGTGANSYVWALAVQIDDKVVIGGFFTSIDVVPRKYVARLNANGSLDPSFATGLVLNSGVRAVALQPDGKVLLGGLFNNTASTFLARLDLAGNIDQSFNAGTGASWVVNALAVQSDEKIIIGGGFSSINSTPRKGIARLTRDGAIDAGFDPGAGADAYVWAVAAQTDGKIIIAGDFSHVNSVSLNRIARLNTDGGLDLGFNPGGGANSVIYSVVLQPDTAVLLGGFFTSFDNVTCNRIARLKESFPVVTGNPTNAIICQGGNWTFNVAADCCPAPSYQWRLNGTNIPAATSSSYSITGAQLVNAGNYFAVVTNVQGIALSSTATLTVQVPPTITQPPVGKTLCQGGNWTFSVAASGTPPLTYQWRLNGSPISGATGSSYPIVGAQTSRAGAYDVIVNNACGSQTSEAANLVVQVPPAITQPSPQDTTLCQGGDWTFSVAASGTPSPTYQWRLNGSPIPGATGSSYPIVGALTSQAGGYDVVVSNPCGTTSSPPAVLTVQVPPKITQPPSGTTLCESQSWTFSVGATGDPAPMYQWRLNGGPIAGATGSSYPIVGAQTNQAGNYDVVVNNPCGSQTSAAAALTVQVAPAIVQAPSGATLCQGQPWTFQVGASASPSPSYQWRLNQVNLPGANNEYYQISAVQPTNAGSYDVVVSNPCGSLTSLPPAVLTVQVPPEITQGPGGGTLCSGGTWTFQVVASGDPAPTYQWRLNGSPIAGATGSSYTVTGAQPTNGGNYDVLVSNPCATRTSGSANLAVRVGPYITQQPRSQSVTQGATVPFSVGAGGDVPLGYQWRSNGVVIAGAKGGSYTLTNVQAAWAGSYDVVVSNSCGVVPSEGATLQVWVPPVITQQPASVTVPQGGAASFCVVATGDPLPVYQWRFNGTNLTGATGSCYSLANVQLVNQGSYDVVVTNNGGSVLSSNATLTVALPPFITQQPVSVIVTQGGAASFSAVAGGDTPLGYQWQFNGVDLGGARSPALNLSNVQGSQAGRYWCVVSNGVGTVTSASARLTVAWPSYVFAWGNDDFGQTDVPAELTNGFTLAIAAGNTHSVAAPALGPVVAWGDDSFGQTEVPTGLAQVVALSASGDHTLALRNDGTVMAWGLNDDGQTNVPVGLTDVLAVAAGGFHSLALKTDGTVVGWGRSVNQQRSFPPELTNVVGIAAGRFFSLVLKGDGIVFACGLNTSGQTNVPKNASNVVMVAAGWSHGLALRNDGSVVAWGPIGSGQTNVPVGLSNVLAIAAGANHTLALKNDGTLVGWGDNSWGQRSIPAGLSNVVAMAGGRWHSVVLGTFNPKPPMARPLNPRRAGQSFALDVAAARGSVCCLEGTDSLGTPAWRVMQSVVGDDSLRTLTDPNATTTQRFYRVSETR